MNGLFPQGGLSQAYTALTRFAGVDRNASRGANTGSNTAFSAEIEQGQAEQVKKADTSDFAADDTLTAQPRAGKDSGFKEYFVANSTSFDPNAPRGSYVNIVV